MMEPIHKVSSKQQPASLPAGTGMVTPFPTPVVKPPLAPCPDRRAESAISDVFKRLAPEADALKNHENPIVTFNTTVKGALMYEHFPKIGSDTPCLVCGKLPEMKPAGGKMRAIHCPHIDELWTRMKDAEARKLRADGWRAKHEGVLPPILHRSAATFDELVDFPETRRAIKWSRRYLADLDENIAIGRGGFWWGDPGTGKGTITKALARSVEEAGYSVLWAKIGSLTDRYFKNSAAVLEALETANFVVLDELGYDQENRGTVAFLYKVIDFRREARKATVVTSNFHRDDLIARWESLQGHGSENDEEFIGVSADRWETRLMAPAYHPLHFTGRDLREVVASTGDDPFADL